MEPDHPAVELLVPLLLELQAFDRLPRTGFLTRGVGNPESLSEHSFQVALLVWLLAARVEGVDRARAVEMALVHDLPELRTGDAPLTAKHLWPRGAKDAAEEAAAAELFASSAPETLALLAEYREGTTTEARFVRACDKLQLMLKVSVYERWGEGDLADFWENDGNFRDGGFPLVAALYSALRRRRTP